MCICINCRHINNCNTYLFIKQQHQFLYNANCNLPLFIPKMNITQVNIISKKNLTSIDWDLIECLSFVEQPGSWSP